MKYAICIVPSNNRRVEKVMVGEFIKDYAQSFEAMAACVTAIVAWWGVGSWRRDLTAGRRATVAEETLTMFYRGRDILTWVRAPGSYADEGNTRTSDSTEDRETRGVLNAYYVPIERLHREAEFWSRFDSARYPFMAVFGGDAASPFEKIRSIRSQILGSSIWLIRTKKRLANKIESADLRTKIEEREDQIWWSGNEIDTMKEKIDKLVSEIEEICRPEIKAALAGNYRSILLSRLFVRRGQK